MVKKVQNKAKIEKQNNCFQLHKGNYKLAENIILNIK